MKRINYLLSLDDNVYFISLYRSLFIFLFFKLLAYAITYVTNRWIKRSRTKFVVHQTVNVICSLFSFALIFFIWMPYLKSIMTIISFISAALTIAIRDIILNVVAGIYIKTKKPFKLEDRISIDDLTGDVVIINTLSFKILEVGDKTGGEQSSGLIVTIPNSYIFSKSLKNYNTAFKYIWNEITIKIKIDADVEKNKNEIMKIINSNKIVSDIPKKAKEQITESAGEYRIYYNHLEPVIYTKVEGNHIDFTLRFLNHPKKSRLVEDYFWTNLLKQYKNNKIDLFVE